MKNLLNQILLRETIHLSTKGLVIYVNTLLFNYYWKVSEILPKSVAYNKYHSIHIIHWKLSAVTLTPCYNLSDNIYFIINDCKLIFHYKFFTYYIYADSHNHNAPVQKPSKLQLITKSFKLKARSPWSWVIELYWYLTWVCIYASLIETNNGAVKHIILIINRV